MFERAPVAARKVWWRSTHGVEAGLSTPVFLVGVQRSGTNMVVRGLERSPEFEVHNENDRRVFHRYELKQPRRPFASVVGESRARYTLFKPLCDSHRTDQLLDRLGTTMPPRAIWAYRGMEGRVRSSLSKFRDHNLTVMADIAAGRSLERWQAQGLRPETMELIRSFDWEQMTPALGLGAVLVRPQPAPVRPGPGRPPRRRGRLVPPPGQGPPPRHRARAEPPRPALRPRPHRPHRPARARRRWPRSPWTSIPGSAAVCAALEERLDAVAQAHHERAVPVHPTVAAPARPTDRGAA